MYYIESNEHIVYVSINLITNFIQRYVKKQPVHEK